MTKYFIKEGVSRPFRLTTGEQISWSPIGDDMGYFATSDQRVINELTAAADRRRGGVRISTKDDVEEAKKKSSARQQYRESSQTNRWDTPRVQDPEGPFPANRAAGLENLARLTDPSVPASAPDSAMPSAPLTIPSGIRGKRVSRPVASTAADAVPETQKA